MPYANVIYLLIRERFQYLSNLIDSIISTDSTNKAAAMRNTF